MGAKEMVLAVARSEVGYLEKSASAYRKDPTVLDRKTDGAGSDNYTKYGRDMHEVYPSEMDFPAYWCDAFIDWCFWKALGKETAIVALCGQFDDYTVSSKRMYVDKGRYNKTPIVGDQIFFTNGTRVCHTGIVYAVDSSKVYTIEGNTSGGSSVVSNGGGVATKSYARSNSRIDGYGHPDYAAADKLIGTATASTTSTTKSKETFDMTMTVLCKDCTGDEVKTLQILLKHYGYFDGLIGGNFLTKTDAAVREYQKANGLYVDGIVGRKTWGKLLGVD